LPRTLPLMRGDAAVLRMSVSGKERAVKTIGSPTASSAL
jgi:hypothetical protein